MSWVKSECRHGLYADECVACRAGSPEFTPIAALDVPPQCAALGHMQEVGRFCPECNPLRSPMDRLSAAQEQVKRLTGKCDQAQIDLRLLRDTYEKAMAVIVTLREELEKAKGLVAQRKMCVDGHDSVLHTCSRCGTVSYPKERHAENCGLLSARAALAGTAGRALRKRVKRLEVIAAAAKKLRDLESSRCEHDIGNDPACSICINHVENADADLDDALANLADQLVSGSKNEGGEE